MADIQKILEGTEEPLRVDNNQETIDGFPVSYDRKSYIQIAESEYEKDPIISALLSNKEVDERGVISPWLLGEFQGLLELSKSMNKEMGQNYIQDMENKLYSDEAVRVGDKYSIGGGNLSPNYDFPPGYKQIISVHTHIWEIAEGTAGFSKYDGGDSDWDSIISRSEKRCASVVLCRNGKGYVAIPQQSLEKTARQYVLANSHTTAYPKSFFLNQVYTQYEVGEQMNDIERISENIKLAEAFNVRLLEIDLKTGKIQKLV